MDALSDSIIKLAGECADEAVQDAGSYASAAFRYSYGVFIERLLAIVKEEREACAQIAQNFCGNMPIGNDPEAITASKIAEAIRARSGG